MLDFLKSMCTPAQAYFVVILILTSLGLCTGQFKKVLQKRLRRNKKKKSTNVNHLLLIFLLVVVALTVIFTLIFNYFCNLGYVNVVGVVVVFILLSRMYKFYKNGF